MKQLFLLILMLFIVNTLLAQSHNPGPNSNCKLNKNLWQNNEKISCPACDNNAKKEKDAIASENKRRFEILAAKEKAEKEAFEKQRLEKIAEDKKTTEASKVYVITQPVIDIKTVIDSEEIESRKYTIVHEKIPYDKSYFSKNRNIKILYNGNIFFESNNYNNISKVHGKILFYASYPSNDSKCKADNSNRAVLINEKGEKISIPSIDKFGFIASSKEFGCHEICVYEGTCAPEMYGVNVKGGKWHTTRYTFNLKTMSLLKSEKSWQLDCNCE